jgi:hypothetical protein
MPRASLRHILHPLNAEMHTDPPFRRHPDLRCRSCGYSISAYADMPTRSPMCSAERPWAPGRSEIDVAHAPVQRAPVHVAHAQRHPMADELRRLREIEEQGQSPATPLIMAGSVWIVAAAFVLFVTAAVYLAVRLGL